jgi:hypothetical protein
MIGHILEVIHVCEKDILVNTGHAFFLEAIGAE